MELDILEYAFEYIQNQSEENIQRDSVAIGTKWDDIHSYEVVGRFPDNSIIGTSKEKADVDIDSTLYEMIESSFGEIIEGLNVQNGAEVTTISLRQTSKWDQMDYPFYSAGDSDAQFFVGISKTSVSEEIQYELTDMVVELLSKWDKSISRESIINSEWFFDDMAIVDLLNVSGIAKTKYPHRYYDVDSVEEYVRKSNKELTLDQEFYNIHYKCSVDQNNSMMEPITPKMNDRVEGIMWDHIESTMDTVWDHKIEGEAIQFGEDGDYEEADDLMKYYVYIPVFNGTRGL